MIYINWFYVGIIKCDFLILSGADIYENYIIWYCCEVALYGDVMDNLAMALYENTPM